MRATLKHTRVSCACGRVAFEAAGAPIIVAVCYCEDCQRGARQIESRPGAPPVLDADGGSAYVLYRRDRFQCLTGRERLQDVRLRPDSPTRRVVADCCNSALFLEFQKGHWVSVYRARIEGDLPPIQVRVQARFKPDTSITPGDVRSYPGLAPTVVFRLLAARVAMLFS